MLMSKAAYAKHRGVSRQTVYDWIAKGKLVVSGSKIDVEATERQASASGNGSTHRTLTMTWGAFWQAVQDESNKTPTPTSDEGICHRVELAASELGYSVEFLEDEGIKLDDGDAEHYFTGYDLKENAWLAIRLLRADLCFTASLCPDELDDWSPEGLNALAGWAKE